MRRGALALAVVVGGLATGSAAEAQTIVYDPSAVGRLVQQYETALQQLEQLKAQVAQGERLYDGFNTASGVDALAGELSAPALRNFLPGADAYVAAAKGDLSALGSLGAAAGAIRSANRVFAPTATDDAGRDLEAQGDRAARDLALGQQVADVGAARLPGLQTLQSAIAGARDVRAVLDLQARLQAEEALIANDQMRLQGLALAQAAEDRIQQQRDRERVARTHAEAEALFKSMTR